MTCSDFIEGFSEYFDGTGAPSFLEEADAHLDACDDCRRYLEVFDRGRELLRSFPEIRVPDTFEARLRHRLFHVEDEETLTRGASGSATTAATTLGIALILVMAAWAPVLWSAPHVSLAPIVVSQPESRPVRLRTPAVARLGVESGRDLVARPANLWEHSASLLYHYSALNGRARGRGIVEPASLD